MEGSLKKARRARGWRQAEAARRLVVSQPYFSMIENGERRITPQLARKLVRVLDLPPTFLPLSDDFERWTDPDRLAAQLGALGYPGFGALSKCVKPHNPAAVLIGALVQDDVEPRLIEGLPWLVARYTDMDDAWLVDRARRHNVQNRLGFIVSLARRFAEQTGELTLLERKRLARLEKMLEESRLARVDTLCHESMSAVEREWLVTHRPLEAAHWNLLTDWGPKDLRFLVSA